MNCVFRQLNETEAAAAFAMVQARMRWMDAQGIRHWNIWDYDKYYPLSYYESRAREGALWGLTDPAGTLASFAVLLEQDENWPDDAPALYVHTLVSAVEAKGAGRALLQEAEGMARRMGKTWLRLDSARENGPLTRLYRDFGFHDAGTCTEGPYRGILRQKRLIRTAPLDKDLLLALVNKAHGIPTDWLEHVELVSVRNPLDSVFKVESETLEHFYALQDRLLSEGTDVELLNSYRTVGMQTETWDLYEKTRGLGYCRKYVAVPGYSEHHTGLAIDVYLVVDGQVIRGVEAMLAEAEPFARVHARIAEYGFILRYPRGAEAVTGYAYEPWHLRYVGREAAQEITAQGITLEEYLQDSGRR